MNSGNSLLRRTEAGVLESLGSSGIWALRREKEIMTVRSKLRPGEICPLHRSKRCVCHGTEEIRKVKSRGYEIRNDGTRVFPDGREWCTPAVLKKRKDFLIKQDPTCKFCGETFNEYDQIELCHKRSKKIGGSAHDDRWENIFLGHKSANRNQGSMPLEVYLESCKSKGIHPCKES